MSVATHDEEIDKSSFIDPYGRYLTQSLFLEINYAIDAPYTLKERDHVYKDRKYISIYKRYMEMEDPTEYEFANKYFVGWTHWKKICSNNMILPYIEGWREELELKLRSQAIRDMMSLCASEGGNFSAAKWLADRGWDKRAAGRPSKGEKERFKRMDEKLENEFADDVKRLQDAV